jgi:hypothetical protein
MVFGLVFLVVMILLGFALGRLMNWLPPQSYRAQKFAQKVNSGFSNAADAARKPFLAMDSWVEAFDRMIHRRG